jgi:hypothetical protein
MKADNTSITGYRQPLGYFQISAATLATATNVGSLITTAMKTLMTASGAVPGYAIIQNSVVGTAVRWRDDGTAPTAAVGMQLYNNNATAGTVELDYAGDIYTLQVILSVGSPILDVTIYA